MSDKLSKNMVLLWTNPNIGAAFGAQTISLDLSKYNYVLVTATFSNAEQRVMSSVIVPTSGGAFRFHDTDTNSAAIWRNGSVSASGITFEAGKFRTDNNNLLCIPYQIFGLKV